MDTNNSCNILARKSCIPCQGGVLPLEQPIIDKLLQDLGGGWAINKEGHLWKHYKAQDFTGSMKFANDIAFVAEAEGHHPDLKVSYGACEVEIWTHKINGLVESDFILAAKIEELYKNSKY